MAAHDVDREIVAVALEPELVLADAGGEVEFAAWRRARRGAVDDRVLPAAAAELVGVVAATPTSRSLPDPPVSTSLPVVPPWAGAGVAIAGSAPTLVSVIVWETEVLSVAGPVGSIA
jgi:hypothetical protein